MALLCVPHDVLSIILVHYCGPLIAARVKHTCKSFNNVVTAVLAERLLNAFPRIGLSISMCFVRSLMCNVYDNFEGVGFRVEEFHMIGHVFTCPLMPLDVGFLPAVSRWFGLPNKNIVAYFGAPEGTLAAGHGLLVFIRAGTLPLACLMDFHPNICTRSTANIAFDGDIDIQGEDDHFVRPAVEGCINVEGVTISVVDVSYHCLTRMIERVIRAKPKLVMSLWRRSVFLRMQTLWKYTDHIKFRDDVIERAPPGRGYVGLNVIL